MPLVSVENDPNTAGGGNIHASQSTVFVNNKAVIVVGDSASPDSQCPNSSAHCNPKSTVGSSNVFVTNKKVHRHNDARSCGHNNIVSGQSTVFANG